MGRRMEDEEVTGGRHVAQKQNEPLPSLSAQTTAGNSGARGMEPERCPAEKEFPTGKLHGGALSGRNSPGTRSGCPRTNSAGDAPKSSLGAERKPSITQGKRSTQLSSESAARNAALSER
ncbi:unnamed protein product [Tetraodon nigroviridis]|uniref:(spotted green pufferfish) hypothetical protein n=1 Tax=Tetraodon nigroviridis TaxID=99883 RepID=Q4ST72_TETNG|nr:unnamed protein product [Tetraodon nigroviridis]